MKMPNWLRKAPHPHHGKWCGGKNTHVVFSDPKPIDELDNACMIHDFALHKAKNIEEKHAADANLYKMAKAAKLKKLGARIYRYGLLLVFHQKRGRV